MLQNMNQRLQQEMPSFILLLLLPVCCWFCAPVCFPQLYIFVHCFLRISSPLFEKSWERYLCCVSPNSRWYSFVVSQPDSYDVEFDTFQEGTSALTHFDAFEDVDDDDVRFQTQRNPAGSNDALDLQTSPAIVDDDDGMLFIRCPYIRVLYRSSLHPGTVSVNLTSGYSIGCP